MILILDLALGVGAGLGLRNIYFYWSMNIYKSIFYSEQINTALDFIIENVLMDLFCQTFTHPYQIMIRDFSDLSPFINVDFVLQSFNDSINNTYNRNSYQLKILP